MSPFDVFQLLFACIGFVVGTIILTRVGSPQLFLNLSRLLLNALRGPQLAQNGGVQPVRRSGRVVVSPWLPMDSRVRGATAEQLRLSRVARAYSMQGLEVPPAIIRELLYPSDANWTYDKWSKF